ncbi:YveK family protein [Halobacillus sp. Marseille-Q1614]|uniref:YveK family protein n=1 Tax=Halobacillus sp. Marseille-Q1614 TaxID=2709134 RepID=UPI0015711747|nr:Wzz/FepE/Etk N-terminal domain-containing protein [Halobacillus sp. Marseille-Q1614]
MKEMDIKTIFRILKRRMAVILITTICISLISGAAVFYFLKPTYEATEYILVGNLGNDEEVYIDPQTINRLVASTVDFITSPIVLESVQAKMNLSQEELEEKITIKNKENSQIISIVIRDADPNQSMELAHLLAAASVEEMKGSLEMEHITLLSKNEGTNKVEEVGNPVVNVLIGTMAGLFCGIAMAMVREHWDDSVQSLDQIEQELGLPVLGEVAATKDKLPKIYQKRFTEAKGNVKKGGGVRAESH